MKARLEVKVPQENVNDPTAKLLLWNVISSAAVKEGDVIAELENSKATFPVTAPVSGVVEYSRIIGEEIPVGATLFYVINEAGAGAAVSGNSPVEIPGTSGSPTPQPLSPVAPQATAGGATGVVFSKGAEALAAQLGLDRSLFAGMAFVRESDVRQKAQEREGHAAKSEARDEKVESGQGSAATVRMAGAGDEEVEKVPLERAKLVENRELLAADRAALKSTLFYFCPAAGLAGVCAQQLPPVPRLVVILFEAVKLLTKFRRLNACLAEDHASLYRHVHIGFAVDMGRGLKVLVIRKAEELSFSELAEKFEELLAKYATDSLVVADVTGSTFTVTDLAQEGVFAFTPLLNNRQAAILGIGAEDRQGEGFMLSCAFDHRLTGGKQVAEFLRDLSARVAFQAASLGASPASRAGLHCARCLQTVEELRVLRAFLLPSVEPPGYLCTNCLAGD